MKKAVIGLVLAGLLGVLISPVVFAQAGAPDSCKIHHDFSNLRGINCPSKDQECKFDDENYDCGMCCTLNAVYTVTDWLFIILVAFAAVMVMWGAFTLLTAGGATEKVTAGRNYIIYAMIGLAVGLFAKAIPALVKVMLGVSSS